MNHFEVENCLRSMEVLVDTREQDTERARERYNRFPCEYVRQALSYGDYAYNFVLPDGSSFLEYSPHEVAAPIVVERKMNLDELAGCFTRSRKRMLGKWRIVVKGENAYIAVLHASNGEVMLTSEIYSTEEGARSGVETIKRGVETGNFVIYRDKGGDYYFKLKSAGNRLLCVG